MFSKDDFDFISNNMKIVVSSIELKLNDPSIADFKPVIKGAVEKFIEIVRTYEASGKKQDLYSCQDNEAEESVISHWAEISEDIDDQLALQVLDALRHSFSCYAYNGLHQLYTRQENECWHPRVVLTEVLIPNDIGTLDSEVLLYRGCDISEYHTGDFKQSWTTSLDVAKLFAFQHYQGQEWFDPKKRIVIQTKYCRDDVLFSDQSIEFEVVVDIEKLQYVRKYT